MAIKEIMLKAANYIRNTKMKMAISKSKRAQFKIQQMAFMLIAVVIFFALVGIFVLAFKLSEIKQSAGLLEEKNAMLLVSRLANSPEFSCGESFGGARINCVDFDKAIILKQDIGKYSGFWGVTGIEIRKVSSENGASCNLVNFPNCSVLKLAEGSNGYDYSNFISLCRKDSLRGEAFDRCEVAKLIVRYD